MKHLLNKYKSFVIFCKCQVGGSIWYHLKEIGDANHISIKDIPGFIARYIIALWVEQFRSTPIKINEQQNKFLPLSLYHELFYTSCYSNDINSDMNISSVNTLVTYLSTGYCCLNKAINQDAPHTHPTPNHRNSYIHKISLK